MKQHSDWRWILELPPSLRMDVRCTLALSLGIALSLVVAAISAGVQGWWGASILALLPLFPSVRKVIVAPWSISFLVMYFIIGIWMQSWVFVTFACIIPLVFGGTVWQSLPRINRALREYGYRLA